MKLFDDSEKMLTRIDQFLSDLSTYGAVLASSVGTKTQYKKPPKGKTPKHKGGHPPIDYSIVEDAATLQTLRNQAIVITEEQTTINWEVYEEMLKLYHKLRRMTNI